MERLPVCPDREAVLDRPQRKSVLRLVDRHVACPECGTSCLLAGGRIIVASSIGGDGQSGTDPA